MKVFSVEDLIVFQISRHVLLQHPPIQTDNCEDKFREDWASWTQDGFPVPTGFQIQLKEKMSGYICY